MLLDMQTVFSGEEMTFILANAEVQFAGENNNMNHKSLAYEN